MTTKKAHEAAFLALLVLVIAAFPIRKQRLAAANRRYFTGTFSTQPISLEEPVAAA